MQNAVAFSDNDVITTAWSYAKKPDGCMGFAVYRLDANGKETPLPSHAVFPGFQIKAGQTTEEFPVQKFYWKDPYARLEAEKTGKRSFRYKVVALEGKPGHLTPMNLPIIISNEVEISPAISAGTFAYFNRGLISTQRVSRAFKGDPTKAKLLPTIADSKSALRASLSGDMVEALIGFLDRAKTSGKIYAALYELGDEELVKKLEGLKKRLYIVLSNSAVTDKVTKKKSDGNQDARDRLEKTAAEKHDRIMPSNHIGHNKFLVYVDQNAKPRAVLFGSTNWTSTGLCAQTNNTVVIEDDALAKRYLNYWKQLAADTKAAKGIPKSLQGKDLRAWDGTSQSLTFGDGSSCQSWFSPNTAAARNSKTKSEKCPGDMNDIIEHINNAKHAILFLVFYPGKPSIANWSAVAARKNKDLFVRGCVTNKSASEAFYYELKGMTPPKKVKGEKKPVLQDPRVFGAEAFDGKIIPEGWQKEILNAGFAIIHDKILVIDPFSDQCVVATGSHNLGYKASYDNDENLMIIQGNKSLATAYATHILDVYDHFSFRYWAKRFRVKKYPLETIPDKWLAKYFDADGHMNNAQLKFWMRAAV
jgi:phosphatidylserine/phosphatidylglycerophosphate/cardiolipin synthase-like enzyme